MDIEKSLPFSEAVVESESKSTSGPVHQRCLNCDTPLTDTFCAHCGQKDLPQRQSIGELLENFISSFWSFESKFLQTGRLIFLKPGRLAKDYTEGKRERYFHPARMYVFISFVYFLFLSVLPDPGDKDTDASAAKDSTTTNFNSNIKGWDFDRDSTKYKTFEAYDSAQKALPADKRDNTIKYFFKKRMAEIRRKYDGTGKDFNADFSENFVGNTPRIFFILLPIFALLLKLLYARRGYYYSEHLVFSIYYYNFFFLAGTLYMLLNQVPVLTDFVWLVSLWIGIYLLVAMKRMYNQSWRKTVFKYVLLSIMFMFCICIGLIGNAFITFMIL